MRTDHEISVQKKLMNKMLKYLGRKTFKIVVPGNYRKMWLSYNRETGIMMRRIKRWNYSGEILEDTNREKAMGGANGDLIFNEIKKAAREKAKSKVVRKATTEELLKNDIDFSELDD